MATGIRREKLRNEATIFTAELYAILNAMENIDRHQGRRFIIYSDFQNAIKAIRNYNTNHPILGKIHKWLLEMASRHKSVSKCWVPSYIGIAGNEMVDQAANMAARGAAVSVNELPHKDYYPTVRKQIMDRWQVQWTNTQRNKLRNVKDTIDVWARHRIRIESGK